MLQELGYRPEEQYWIQWCDSAAVYYIYGGNGEQLPLCKTGREWYIETGEDRRRTVTDSYASCKLSELFPGDDKLAREHWPNFPSEIEGQPTGVMSVVGANVLAGLGRKGKGSSNPAKGSGNPAAAIRYGITDSYDDAWGKGKGWTYHPYDEDGKGAYGKGKGNCIEDGKAKGWDGKGSHYIEDGRGKGCGDGKGYEGMPKGQGKNKNGDVKGKDDQRKGKETCAPTGGDCGKGYDNCWNSPSSSDGGKGAGEQILTGADNPDATVAGCTDGSKGKTLSSMSAKALYNNNNKGDGKGKDFQRKGKETHAPKGDIYPGCWGSQWQSSSSYGWQSNDDNGSWTSGGKGAGDYSNADAPLKLIEEHTLTVAEDCPYKKN